MDSQTERIDNVPYDQIRKGQRAQSVHTLTREDVGAQVIDADQAMNHGLWAGTLVTGLLTGEFPGVGTECLEQQLRFVAPVSVGDVLTTQLMVIRKEDANRRVTLDCLVLNQRGEQVVSGQVVVRAPAQPHSGLRAVAPTRHLFEPDARLEAWMATLAGHPPVRCAVVHPCDEASLRGALDAAARGLIVPVLVGPGARVRALAQSLSLDISALQLVDTPHSHASAASGAQLAASGKVAMLMKGSLHTDELMQAVIGEPLLRTERRMSHVFRFEVPAYDKPLLITDAAINIAPTLEEKADIVRNVIDLAHALGVAQPLVALLSAVETVTPRMVSTLDAAALCKMADRGQIKGALLDGPLAFDNAISPEAARVKGIDSPVAGRADVLVVPDIEAGNMLAKQLEYLAGASSCGVVLGARVPIALTSRADPPLSRVASAALAAVMSRAMQAPR